VRAATPLLDSPAPQSLTPRAVLVAWRGITRRQVLATFALGCALYVLGSLTGVTAFTGPRGQGFVFVATQIRAFALLLAFVVADRIVGGDAERRWPYALAVVVGAILGTFAAAGFLVPTANHFLLEQMPYPSIAIRLYLSFDLVLVGWATVWVILDRRRAAQARARMQRAELERIDAEKRSVESDLQALQARVEPQFLFNTLAQVHDLHRADAAKGARMLDELIAYLRAAMPLMRDTSSTLAQELELTRAYLAIVAIRLGDRLDSSTRVPAAGGDVRMPPMMLLPLVDHAVARGVEAGRPGGRLRVDIEVSGERVRLSIVDGGAGFLPTGNDDRIAEIRSRLAALYGDRGTLTLKRHGADASEAVLDFPLERAEAA